MKGKSKKFIVGIILCAVGVIGLFGLFADTDSKAALAVGSVLLIIAGGVCVFLDKKYVKKSSNNSSGDIYAQAEAARQNNEYYNFKVAGVTFNNGRKTRQAILRKIKWGDEPFNGYVQWTIDKYDFEGQTAVGVYANGEQVGSVPKECLSYILDNWDRIKSVYHTEINGGGTTEEGTVLNFGCEVTLCLSK